MIKYICVILLLLLLLLTGCWDKVELDDRALVLGAAIDIATQDDKSLSKEYVSNDSPNAYRMTLETSMTKKSSGNGEEGGGSQQKDKAAMIYTETGTSFFEITRKMATGSDRSLFFGHQQVLIIGKELAMQRDLSKTLDFWGREPEMDQSMHVFITRGNANNIFNADAKNSDTVSMFIKEQSDQIKKTSQFISIDVVQLFSKLADSSDLLIGSIGFSDDNNLRISGSGVIKKGKLIGWLDENETRAAQFVMGEVKGGQIVAKDPEREESFITTAVSKVKTQLKADIKNGIPYFTISIKLECNISEIGRESKGVDEKTITKVEKAVSDTMEKQIRDTVEKLQKQYEADVLGFGEKLNKYHNKDWKEMKPKWDKIYPEVPVSVKVSTKVRKIGRTY